MRAIELFAGAGGLALGTTRAGFRHVAVVERDRNACDTIRLNNERGTIDWPLRREDVAGVDFRPFDGIDLLAGGPPCQPFSLGGKHRGAGDRRNMFPEAVRAVREARPRAVILENVKGLLRPAFAPFLRYILLQLALPERTLKERETWADHLARLECGSERTGRGELAYRVALRRLDAADYGVPQRRERILIVGLRGDLAGDWDFPSPTHSRSALDHDQWVTGDYWDRHRIAKRHRPEPPRPPRSAAVDPPVLSPWRTVRDALADLPDPRAPSREIPNHQFNPGARVYPGHTGSPLDFPAKTLKAGDHGVPGGENMMRAPDGQVRYFTVRESARLQTFPDDFLFSGAWSEAMRQLGNAVPVTLAEVVARSVSTSLATPETQRAAPGSRRGSR